MIGAALIDHPGGIPVAITDPWARVKSPPPIPEESELASTLAAMDPEDFAELVRAHLQPRDDVRAWNALWATLRGDDDLADRAFDVLEEMDDLTQAALATGELDDSATARAKKFARFINEAWNRLERDPEDHPLAWAGKAGHGFNPPSQRVIARLVEAIAAHRRAHDAGEISEVDRKLWATLGRVGLDPDKIGDQRRRTR